eukprot:TRINITY_DN2191_c0_g1_i2.p1 TRINITY_DN2191_c0_g1~~TRINITY_DN2191_c0_g1_i2.p1  ORF type:complete len:587 (+),score=76.36 TRINITY_DN2191_c0_g1_i2:340-2100(+)
MNDLIQLIPDKPKLSNGLSFLISFFIYLFMVLQDQSYTPQRHGAINALLFSLTLIIILVINFSILLCYKNLPFSRFLFNLFSISVIIFIIIMARFMYIHSDFIHGFGGKDLEPNRESCNLPYPAFNFMGLVPYRGLSFWAGSTVCPQVKRIASFIDDSTLKVDCRGKEATVTRFPTLNHFSLSDRLNDNFQNSVLLKSISTTTRDERVLLPPNTEEVTVQCGQDKNTLIRSVRSSEVLKRVKSLRKQKSKSFKKNGINPSNVLNVVILNFDAVSRPHFYRRLPKAGERLEEINRKGVTSVFEMKRFHAVGITTIPNSRAMYLGLSSNDDEDSYRTSVPIWEDYYQNGYVTALIDNSCLDWSGKYQKERSSLVDHHVVGPFCQPEVHPLHNPYGNWNGPFSVRRRCLHGRYSHSYLFDYTLGFLRNYHDQPRFVLAQFNEGHEGTGDVIGTVDDDLAKFLTELETGRESVLNNSVVFIVSDHGLHMGLFFMLGMRSARIENGLPTWFMSFPNWFLRDNPRVHDIILNNEQALVTPYDLYETLRGLIDFPLFPNIKPRRPNSVRVIDEVVPPRNCDEAGIPSHACRCS